MKKVNTLWQALLKKPRKRQTGKALVKKAVS